MSSVVSSSGSLSSFTSFGPHGADSISLLTGSATISGHHGHGQSVTLSGGADASVIGNQLNLSLGSNDTLALSGSGDTVSLSGRVGDDDGGHHTLAGGSADSLLITGQASVTGLFGQATVGTGSYQFVTGDHGAQSVFIAAGNATLDAGNAPTDFKSTSSGNVSLLGGRGDTLEGGVAGSVTMTGAQHGGTVFDILSGAGNVTITNFVSGDTLQINGQTITSAAQLKALGATVTTHDGSTVITMGGTTVDLKNFVPPTHHDKS
jgi:hypothetical protein